MSRVGSQEPRIALSPEWVTNDGDDAIRLSGGYGLVPDEWQETVLRSWMGRDAEGLWSSPTCGLIVPRQNGKNAILEMRELFGLVVLGERILHTAHEVKTSRKAFRRLCSFFENQHEHPELSSLLSDIRRTNGQEAILLRNGGSVEFIARSRNSGRGFTVDCVVCDEAQELTDEQLSALLYTKSAAPLHNPQLILVGTPPSFNARAEVFGRTREDAIAGADRLSWHEWSVDEIGDVTDVDRWYETNPALGIRISERDVADELRLNSEDGFARERLGWWPYVEKRSVISREEWSRLATSKPPEDGKLGAGIKFSPDGARVALAVALRPPSGPVHVEIAKETTTAEGISWLRGWIESHDRTCSCVVIDGLSGASALIESLGPCRRNKRFIVTPRVSDVISSSVMFLDAVHERSITHFDQPALTDAALSSSRRAIGKNGGWGWESLSDASITPLEAASLAYWGIMTTKRDPSRRMRVL